MTNRSQVECLEAELQAMRENNEDPVKKRECQERLHAARQMKRQVTTPNKNTVVVDNTLSFGAKS